MRRLVRRTSPSVVAALSAGGAHLAYLDAHNTRRCMHGTPALQWSAAVAASAQAHADKCLFQHSSGPYGENLYMSWYRPATAEAAVKAWYDEVKDYNYARPGFSSQTGHFTQVVWRGSTALGCGMCQKGSQYIVVCQYSPAGNVQGRYPENVLQASASENECRSGDGGLPAPTPSPSPSPPPLPSPPPPVEGSPFYLFACPQRCTAQAVLCLDVDCLLFVGRAALLR